MTRSWWTKFVLVIAITVGAGLSLVPTFLNLDPLTTKFPFTQKVNLGLDLQGGLYLVMKVDFDRVYQDLVEKRKSRAEASLKEKSVTTQSLEVTALPSALDDPRLKIRFPAGSKARVREVVEKELQGMRLVSESDDGVEYALTFDERAEVRERTLNQSIEVIRNRIDEFGVAEPSISSQGSDRVVVELPGIQDVDRAKDLIGRTAKLEFRIVDDTSMAPGELETLIKEQEKTHNISFDEKQGQFSEYVRKLNAVLKERLPKDTEVAFERVKNSVTGEVDTGVRIPHLLNRIAMVTGEDLADAQVGANHENGLSEVQFQMSPRGAVAFGKLTGENVKKRLAILLDGMVFSAPVINSKIEERGVITVGGNYDQALRESRDLAIVLRAGALPARLELSEQRVVGPSLGADSVKKGAMASLIGILAVFLITALYYRVSGLIAVVSLAINVVLVLSILVFLGATLTLPGIAGIALTVGIAVDSNVVIYERIREELNAGKKLLSAVEAGFEKAFKTILDANVVNGIAAVILMLFGTGPIKGFAVTMLVGIVTTLFTAVFVCRVLFDLYLGRLEARNSKTISI